jgi:hypothetical protein
MASMDHHMGLEMDLLAMVAAAIVAIFPLLAVLNQMTQLTLFIHNIYRLI